MNFLSNHNKKLYIYNFIFIITSYFLFLLGLGTLAEASRRVVGLSDAPKNGSGGRLDGSVVLTEANAERIVQTLCRVRGKLKYLYSINPD